MKDFGNEMYSGDCFWFAAIIQGLDIRKDFMRVLKMIINDLQLNISLPYNNWRENSNSKPDILYSRPLKTHFNSGRFCGQNILFVDFIH